MKMVGTNESEVEKWWEPMRAKLKMVGTNHEEVNVVL